jgi:adenosine deaminase
MDKNMHETNPNHNSQVYNNFPKVELHRHLEGSLRVSTLKEIALAHQLSFSDHINLEALVQVQPDDPLTFANFLSKFQPLRLFYQSPQIITRVVQESIADAAAENIQHLELRFTPVALARAQGYPLSEVMDWVISSAQQAARQFHISISLIASVNRHESVQLAQEVARLAMERGPSGIAGLDLAGNEAEFPALQFAGILHEAQKSGLKITIHAGEWGGAQNVREAIEDLHADRIGHGVRVLEDPRVVDLARERQLPFEVCVTSNCQSGVCASVHNHPICRMLEAGLNVTINTDDPGISNITLSSEYQLLSESLGFSTTQLRERVLAAVDASFLTANQKQALHAKLASQFQIEN